MASSSSKKQNTVRQSSFLFPLFIIFSSTPAFSRAQATQLPGSWQLLLENAGIASMHTAVTHFGTVLLLDRTDIGSSQLRLSPRHCRHDASDRVLPRGDCTAHSAIFDPSTISLRPLSIVTDTWCSSGQFLPNGTLLQTGGDNDGLRRLRTFSPCAAHRNCDWRELDAPLLAVGRWYATDQILPDGSVIIVGGRAAPSVEFYPPRQLHRFPFLTSVEDSQMDNLYPFVHLLPNGHLFIFANTRAVLYDVDAAAVLLEYPQIPGGPRSYPSAGSSIMLALDPSAASGYSFAEIVVCGGAQFGAFLHRESDAQADTSCGRITPTDPNPEWSMEEMPFPRIMGDMVMLPTSEILIVNGAMSGAQGFEMATKPCLNPLLYRPSQPAGLRFMTLTPTTIARMYHSTANLLPDGRVLVAGSNPHYFYKFNAEFPTELRLETFSPEYLSLDRKNLRPEFLAAPEKVGYGELFEVEVSVELPLVGLVEVNLASAPFSTHSFSQGQRLVKLAASAAAEVNGNDAMRHFYRLECTAPPDGKIAPPGYYMAFAVNQGVPSVAKWVQLVR